MYCNIKKIHTATSNKHVLQHKNYVVYHPKLCVAPSQMVSIATSQKLTMKHGKEIFESHLSQQPKNLIATFKNHLLQHQKNHCNTEKQ